MESRGNPFIENALAKNRTIYDNKTMTLYSTIIKILFLLTVLIISFYSTDIIVSNNNFNLWYICIASSVIAFLLAIITKINPILAKITSIFYSISQGIMLGTISKILDSNYPQVVVTSVFLTITVLIIILIIYRSIIDLSENLANSIAIGIYSIGLMYLLSFLLNVFGVNVPVFSSGIFGIVFNLIVIVLAIFNLTTDYKHVIIGVNYGAAKYMEWYYALGIIISLIWLYVEIIGLLEKIIYYVKK